MASVRGTGLRAKLRRLLAGAPILWWYSRRLPAVTIQPSDSPAGRLIRRHLTFRRDGRLKYRQAQGVLLLPETVADYLRGRHRQAVRTNVRHARHVGMTVALEEHLPDWEPGTPDGRFGALGRGPAERWVIRDAAGAWVGEAILTVDRTHTLLHGMVVTE